MEKFKQKKHHLLLPIILGLLLSVSPILSVDAQTNESSSFNSVQATVSKSTTSNTVTTKHSYKNKKISTKNLNKKLLKEHPHDGPDDKKTLDTMGLPIYNPKKDKAPQESIAIKETNFKFAEPLLVRPKTDMIVVHHVAIPSGDISAAQIHKAHLANGWAGIGYHYLIRKDGTIERGRPLATVGAHAYGENFHTIGICVAGNFNEENLEPAQYNALYNLIQNLCKIYDIMPDDHTLVGHRDLNDTSCPGEYLYMRLPQLRQELAPKLTWDKKMDLLFPKNTTKSNIK